VLAPYTGEQTVVAPSLTRYDIARRHDGGARITTQPAGGAIPPGTDLLFLISPDGTLIPAPASQATAPVPGSSLVLLGPSPAPR
jgi:hypothetical protein